MKISDIIIEGWRDYNIKGFGGIGSRDLYVVEKRKSDGSLDLSEPQPPDKWIKRS